MADNLPVDIEYEGEENQPSATGISSSFFYNVPGHTGKGKSHALPSVRYASDSDGDSDQDDPSYKVNESDIDTDSDVPLSVRKDDTSTISRHHDSDDDIAEDDENAINDLWDEPSVLVNPEDEGLDH